MSNKRSIIQRHRRKLVISSAIFATLFATFGLTIYLSKRWLYNQHMKLTEQRFVKEQIKRRFVQTQQDSLYTLYELLPVMTLVMAKDFDLDSIVESLKGKKLQKKLSRGDATSELEGEGLSSGMSAMTPASVSANQTLLPDGTAGPAQKSKAELWNELKLKAISKVIILSYTMSLLMLLTRLQLNILARREYLDTAINMAMEKEREHNANQYSLSSWFSRWINSKTKDIVAEEYTMNSSDIETKSVASTTNPEKTRYVNEQASFSIVVLVAFEPWISAVQKHHRTTSERRVQPAKPTRYHNDGGIQRQGEQDLRHHKQAVLPATPILRHIFELLVARTKLGKVCTTANTRTRRVEGASRGQHVIEAVGARNQQVLAVARNMDRAGIPSRRDFPLCDGADRGQR